MKSKNVLITGSAKRVGAACARLLHAEGCNIFLHYRSSKKDAKILCDELNQQRSGSARLVRADLLLMNELEALAEKVKGEWGGLDVLVNNASAFFPTSIAEVTEQQWNELLGSNLKAPFFLTRALSESLAQRAGCVINIADIHAERGLKGYSVYSIAKAALVAMTTILAKELAPHVRVNAVSPGAIIWPEKELSDREKQKIISLTALQREGSPDDIARAVRFLIKDAGYITGQIIKVDGGRNLNC